MYLEREETTFAELIDRAILSIGDGYRAKNAELGGDGPIFLRAGHVSDTHIDFADVERFHAELEPRLLEKMSEPGDVIVTTKGNSTGRTSFVTEAMPQFVYSPHLSRWRSLDEDALCPRYLRYWSRSREFIVQLNGMKASTDMAPYLSLRDQRMLCITLPSIDEQRKTAEVLGSLDDKTELNRRMNRTLEEMAAAIFKAWFVDFEPVKAKAAGAKSFPSMPQPVFDSLPTEFTDSPLGPIPKWWETRPLNEVLGLSYGKALKADNRIPGPVPVYGSNGAVGWHNEYLVKGPGIVVGRKGNPGIVTWADRDFFPIDTTFYVSLTELSLGLHYVFHQLRSLGLPALSADSAVPGLNRNMAYMSHVLVPDVATIRAFELLSSELMALVTTNGNQSVTLAAIRDALLPKLLSGEIRVSEAERIAEEVA